MTAMTRYWDVRGGELIEISERESYELMHAPADGIYDEAWRVKQREHEARVIAKYDALPNRGLKK